MCDNQFVFSPLGASNHVSDERAINDYYATDPKAVELLLTLEAFAPVVWEPACGEGHIAKVLQSHGYKVIATDLIYRGFGERKSIDFLTEAFPHFKGDIITNPPYSAGMEFVKRALETVRPGGKVAMFLKVQFLEGKKRGELFAKTPPRTIYISRSRLACYKNGDLTTNPKSAIAYAWYVWEKGFTGDPVVKWFN